MEDGEQNRHHACRPMNLPKRAEGYTQQICENAEVRTGEQWDQVDDGEGPGSKAGLRDGRSPETEAKYVPCDINQLHQDTGSTPRA
jgi:hypothetical protein